MSDKKYTLAELLYFAHKELGISSENLHIDEISLIVYEHFSENYTKKLTHHAINLAKMFRDYKEKGYVLALCGNTLKVIDPNGK